MKDYNYFCASKKRIRMKGTKTLTEGNITKQLSKLALPIMATAFIQMAYSLTDMAWVGRIGSEAVAAVGSVGILTWMSTSISLLCKVGSEVSIGQAIGSHNAEEAKQYASHNSTMSILISSLWGLLLIVFATPIINVYELAPEITQNAIAYLRIIALGMPAIFLSAAFTGIYNACGRSNIPFYISGSGLIMNMILDPLFIFGFNWGTIGAALATIFSQYFVLLLFFIQIRKRDKLFDSFSFIVRLKKHYTRRILKIGAPVALFNTLFAFANMYICRIAAINGGHIGLMTFTTGGQIEGITWNTSQGFSTALGAFTAQNYAAGKRDRYIKAYKSTLAMTSIFGVFSTILFVFFGQEVFSIFVPEEAAYIAGGEFLRIDGYSQMFMMLEIATQGVFYGIGRTIPPAITSICGNYLRIPLALGLTAIGMGVSGIWWAVSISSILKGITLFFWLMVIRKRVMLTDFKYSKSESIM